ncbi:Fructosamine kinase-domain-containing protein [Podospora didyma]|uniref:protein-ribulosamine 3-kinase n=1 Tax=Podospora didyma TaxID=330526 RepID=A0AAE0NC21_9PEZI|nr:Fructosamine kinase-domain-containing protein [Podospora didyma]
MPDVSECSDGYVPLPRKGPSPFASVDPGITAVLPEGSRIVDVAPHGESFWTQTARLVIKLADGTERLYFLKVALGEHGMRMMNGEFKSMTALDIAEELPEIASFTPSAAQLHQSAQSPNGKYGFPVTTYIGPLPQDNSWCDTWEEYFTQGMRRMLESERNVQGLSEELDGLAVKLYEKAIPRLLRPLATLRSIRPALIPGDLWYGNCCTDVATGNPIVFDACAFWAHNEYEIGTWRQMRYRVGEPYIKAYQDNFPASAPGEDHDGRSALHPIRFDIHSSAAYSSSTWFRRDFMTTMKLLIDKHPRGYEEWEKWNADLIAAAHKQGQELQLE